MMANEKRLIDANALTERVDESKHYNPHHDGKLIANHRNEHDHFFKLIYTAPTVDAIPVSEIEAYLQARLDEWEALGDRKWEPANMWGYNFIMACFDDLERRREDGK